MDSFVKLHIKILVNILLVHACLLACILLSLYVFVRVSSTEDEFDFLETVLENDGVHQMPMEVMPDCGPKDKMPPLKIPGPVVTPDHMAFRNFYSIKIQDDGSVVEIMKDMNGDITDGEIVSSAYAVLKMIKSGEKRGIITNRILWKHKLLQNDSVHFISFLDRRNELIYYDRIASVSFAVFFGSLVVAFFFAWFLSSWTVKKVKGDFERQKQFISDASHELRTPLAVINANVDVLAGTIPDNKWIAYIKTEIIRMNDLIKELLYLAKSDVNKQKFDMKLFDMSAAINEVALPFESTVYEQGKKFEINIPGNVLNVYGDEKRIQQIAVILIDNAVKNSEKGAVIRVSLSSGKSRRVLKVYNTGTGIKSDEIEKIFERFYRSDSSRNRQTGGCGLGLAIARSIAEAHKGCLSAKSDYGKWAEFTFEIPFDSKNTDKAIG